jgi:hypothetical protein
MIKVEIKKKIKALYSKIVEYAYIIIAILVIISLGLAIVLIFYSSVQFIIATVKGELISAIVHGFAVLFSLFWVGLWIHFAENN